MALKPGTSQSASLLTLLGSGEEKHRRSHDRAAHTRRPALRGPDRLLRAAPRRRVRSNAAAGPAAPGPRVLSSVSALRRLAQDRMDTDKCLVVTEKYCHGFSPDSYECLVWLIMLGKPGDDIFEEANPAGSKEKGHRHHKSFKTCL